MPGELHQRLLQRAVDQGWEVGKWKAAFHRKAREPHWRHEYRADRDFQDIFKGAWPRPDAWRIIVEGPETPGKDWGHEVLVLEFLEVEVTHFIGKEKQEAYEGLWWQFDGTSLFHFRVFQMDKYGTIRLYLDRETIYQQA